MFPFCRRGATSALVRGSLVLNVAFLIYLFAHVSTYPPSWGSQSPVTGIGNETSPLPIVSEVSDYPIEDLPTDSEGQELLLAPPAPPTPSPTLQEKVYPDLHSCHTPPLTLSPLLHGNYWILYNYIAADTQPSCNESITYTTHSDYTFLDNLTPLIERWKGPISVAVFTPGVDFNATLRTITFLRHCRPLVAQHVTFHLFFPVDRMPIHVPPTASLLASKPSCAQPAPYILPRGFRRPHNLTYPVNVARNAARSAAATYFVLASDIELYPSIGFIQRFLDMMHRQDASRLDAPTRRVYVLPIFEVKSGLRPPTDKVVMLKMLLRGAAIPFHKFVCEQCHKVPNMKEWADVGVRADMGVVAVAKRHPPYQRWEPIYVGTHLEPLYDERLTWEGRSDKMTQMYVMCVLDYEFHILDDAFLVHRPGIKKYRKDPARDLLTSKQNYFVHSVVKPELDVIYGHRNACFV